LRYVFDNADLKALVFQRGFAPLVRAVRDSMPTARHLIVLEDGSDASCDGLDAIGYEAAMAAGIPERDFPPRSGDDLYILYTGGTTGMPKGVLWRHEDVFFAMGGGIDVLTGERAQRPEDLAERGKRMGGPLTFLPGAPLMHGAT